MSIIAEIGRLIGSTMDIDEVYERFAAEAGKLIPFDRLVVNLNKPQEGTLSCTYVFGLTVSGRKPGDSFPLARSINEVLLTHPEGLDYPAGIHRRDCRPLPSLVSTFEAGMRSMMSVPLISRDEVIGGLHFRSEKPNSIHRRDNSAWRRGLEPRSPGLSPMPAFLLILKRPKRNREEIVRKPNDWPKK